MPSAAGTDQGARSRQIALRVVLGLSLLMLLLQLLPWRSAVMQGVFSGADTHVYAERGSWAISDKVPYADLYFEYPPLNIPLVAIPHFVPGLDYRAAFIAMNFLVYLAILRLYWRSTHLASRGPDSDAAGPLSTTPWSILVLGLPSVLYNTYTFNDVWVAGVVMTAFVALSARRNMLAVVLLSTSIFLKSYPVFLLPVVFFHIVSQEGPAEAWLRWSGRLRGYTTSLARGESWEYIGASLLVALVIGAGFTGWLGTQWIAVGFDAFSAGNPESFAYVIQYFSPTLMKLEEAAQIATALFLALWTAGLLTIRFRDFSNTLHFSIVVVLASSMITMGHSPHWNLWFFFLLPLIPVSPALFLLLLVYDLNNLLYWPFLSRFTPIEALRPASQEYFRMIIIAQCALKIGIIGWLLYGMRRRRYSKD